MEYYFDSEEFKDTSTYKNFINVNDGKGILKIEASTANEAYPLDGVEITISKKLDGNNIIFYKGKTNESGIIDGIVLPTRRIYKEIENASDIVYTTYDLLASYSKYNFKKEYDVSIFDDIKVIQPITISVNDLIEGEENV